MRKILLFISFIVSGLFMNLQAQTYSFTEVAFTGSQFVPFPDAPTSGELTSITGDFVLNSQAGTTWASDLAIFVTDTPTYEAETTTIFLQVGGWSTYGAVLKIV